MQLVANENERITNMSALPAPTVIADDGESITMHCQIMRSACVEVVTRNRNGGAVIFGNQVRPRGYAAIALNAIQVAELRAFLNAMDS